MGSPRQARPGEHHRARPLPGARRADAMARSLPRAAHLGLRTDLPVAEVRQESFPLRTGEVAIRDRACPRGPLEGGAVTHLKRAAAMLVACSTQRSATGRASPRTT